MAATPEASVAPWKRELVNELQEKFEEYPVVGILDISGIPAKQFQEIRDILRGKAEIKVSRKVLLRIAIEKASEDQPELEELADCLEGPSALIFTEMNPFRLWKLLEENRTTAPAKVGMEAPEDIVIPEGETGFSPGPVVGELQRAGVNARIQAGDVVVLEDSKIVEEGEEISEDVVGVLSRFGIEPREIGFELRAAYADGIVFPGESLIVDEEETRDNVQAAYINTLKLAQGVQFPTAVTVPSMLSEAHSQAHNLALNASIYTHETVPQLLSMAQSKMLNLSSNVSSQDPEALGEELKSMLTTEAPPEETETSEQEKTEEEKPKEEPEEKVEEEKVEEEESSANLGGLFE